MANTEKLNQVLELTRKANASARAGDWTEVVEIEAERRPLLREVFVTRADAASIDPDSIREILDCDRELIELARAQRTRASKRALASRHKRQAIGEYAEHAR